MLSGFQNYSVPNQYAKTQEKLRLTLFPPATAFLKPMTPAEDGL
jgi:hypothetical protein